MVQFVVGIVLARLLLPEDFGLIGMLVIFMAIAQAFLDSGFGAALIQKKGITEEDVCSIFYFNISVGIGAAGLLCLFSPWIANFFNQPVLKPLVRVMSIIIVINSFGLIQDTLLRKRIDFRSITIATLIASVSSGIVGILLAINGFGVWSLAVQQITNSFTRTVMLWFINAWRPALIFKMASLKGMFGFGSRLLASSLLSQIFDNIYLIVIGKMFSAADLGYYTRAKQFQELPTMSLSGMVAKVIFPVFSEIKDDPIRLKRGLKKALTSLGLINFPMMIGLAVVSKPLVLTLLTDKWISCVPFLQVLCVVGMLFPLHLINLNLLQALGRSDLFLRLEIIKKILIVISIAITYRWGILPMIWGQVVVSVLSYFLNCYYSMIFIKYSMIEQLRDLLSCMVASALMGFGVYCISLMSFNNISLLLIIQVLFGILIYFTVCRVFQMEAFMELYRSALFKIATVKNKI